MGTLGTSCSTGGIRGWMARVANPFFRSSVPIGTSLARSGAVEAVELGFRAPQHQLEDGVARRDALVQHAGDHLGDRHLHPHEAPQIDHGPGGLHAFGDHALSATISSSERPLASWSPTWWLRESFDEHVAMRSPIPASPWKVSGSAPIRTPSL